MITWALDDYDTVVLRGHLTRLLATCDVTLQGDLRRLLYSLDAAVKAESDSLFCYCDTNLEPGGKTFIASYRIGNDPIVHVNTGNTKLSEYYGLIAVLQQLNRQFDSLPAHIIINSDAMNLVRSMNSRATPKNSHSSLYREAVGYLEVLEQCGHHIRIVHLPRKEINAALKLPQ